MKFLLNYRPALTLALVLGCHLAGAQVYINPVKNLTVTLSADTLLFEELVSKKLLFKLPVKKGTASHYIKFSPLGNFLITSGTGPVSNLYIVHRDTAILAASLPVLTEEGVFSASENELFLLHSKSLSRTRLSSYNTKSWKKLADARLPAAVHDLTIDASGSLLGFCENSNIRTLYTLNLKKDNVYRQITPQRLLIFNPAVPDQAASVNKENHIQIRDIKKDTVLMEINVHRSKIIWLGYDLTGNLLVSLDEQGYLFTWKPSLKECLAQFKGVEGIPAFHPNGTLTLSASGESDEFGFVKDQHCAGN